MEDAPHAASAAIGRHREPEWGFKYSPRFGAALGSSLTTKLAIAGVTRTGVAPAAREPMERRR